MSATGKCTAWLPHKGFGFIEENGPEKRSVFCHQSNLKTVEGGFRALNAGQEVQFDVEMLNDKPNALNVSEVGGAILASCTNRGRGRGGGDHFPRRGGGQGGGYGDGYYRGGGRGGFGAPRGGGGFNQGYQSRGGGGGRGGGGAWGPRGGFAGDRQGFGQNQQQ